MPTRRVKTIRAVQPNAGIAAWYSEKLEAPLNEALHELLNMLAPVMPVIPVGTPKVVQQLAHDAGVGTIRQRLKQWGDRWAKKFDALAPKLAASFTSKNFVAAQASFASALRDAGFTVKFQTTRASMEAYKAVLAENVGLIRSIPQQFHTQVETLVWQAVKRGSDMGTLSTQLRQQYGVTVRRAALIARDQNAKAKATIENTQRQQLGITLAIWQHSHGGKTPRPNHVAMNGKVFDLAKGMWDDVERQFILPGQLINCRCSSRAILPGIEE